MLRCAVLCPAAVLCCVLPSVTLLPLLLLVLLTDLSLSQVFAGLFLETMNCVRRAAYSAHNTGKQADADLDLKKVLHAVLCRLACCPLCCAALSMRAGVS